MWAPKHLTKLLICCYDSTLLYFATWLQKSQLNSSGDPNFYNGLIYMNLCLAFSLVYVVWKEERDAPRTDKRITLRCS